MRSPDIKMISVYGMYRIYRIVPDFRVDPTLRQIRAT